MNYNSLRQFAPQIKQIAEKHGIAKAYLFGSTARCEVTAQSDIDFLVEKQEGVSLFGIGGFSYEAEKLLGVRVDVVPMSTLPLVRDREFVKNIQADAIVL